MEDVTTRNQKVQWIQQSNKLIRYTKRKNNLDDKPLNSREQKINYEKYQNYFTISQSLPITLEAKAASSPQNALSYGKIRLPFDLGWNNFYISEEVLKNEPENHSKPATRVVASRGIQMTIQHPDVVRLSPIWGVRDLADIF